MSESNPEAPAAAPAEPAAPTVHKLDGSIDGPPLDIFVKGGTTTQRWDDEKKAFYADTEARQAHQDKQRQAVMDASAHGGAIAGIHSMQLMHGGSPKVVIHYRKRDKALETDAECEIAVMPDPTNPTETGMILALVCPKCLERTGKQFDSQIQIKSWEKKFWLRPSSDPDFPADKRIWVNYMDGRPVMIAGTITVADICRCDATGCSYAFRIEDSELWEV